MASAGDDFCSATNIPAEYIFFELPLFEYFNATFSANGLLQIFPLQTNNIDLTFDGIFGFAMVVPYKSHNKFLKYFFSNIVPKWYTGLFFLLLNI